MNQALRGLQRPTAFAIVYFSFFSFFGEFRAVKQLAIVAGAWQVAFFPHPGPFAGTSISDRKKSLRVSM